MNQKRIGCFRWIVFIIGLVLLQFMGRTQAGDLPVVSGSTPKINGGLQAEVFRFVRTEQRGFAPVFRDGELIIPGVTNTVGVFQFRYHGPGPADFFGFGSPIDGKFGSRFTGYRVHDANGWRELGLGYCGTGAAAYPLLPDTDYELEISLAISELAKADQISVSFDSPIATFWSEPFAISRR
ncbi:MAG TPA: hypothetical protein VN625_05800 [Desulfuromonadaceae bacterium]|nr:hypothetical protein [Desulfuromonadaceae bacterium]